MKNKRTLSDHKKKTFDLLIKRPEGLAGLVVLSIILSYLILSPTDKDQNVALVDNDSDIQSINLPIPSDEQDDIAVHAPEAQKDEIVASEIEDVETPVVEELDVALEETQAVDDSVVLESIPKKSAELKKSSEISKSPVSKVKEKVAVVKIADKTPKTSVLKQKDEPKKTAVKSWVFAKESDLYTIQLIGSSNRKEIEKFVKANQKEKKLSYFNTIKNNKNWYVVVLGSYKSFKEAENQRKNLPPHLAKYGPWTRNYLSIQKEITANAEKIILLSNAFATNE